MQEGGFIQGDNSKVWVLKYSKAWVQAWAWEIGFAKPLKAPYLSLYNNGFGHIVKLDPNSTKTIIGYTNRGVVVN
jgi:hypothetical protein